MNTQTMSHHPDTDDHVHDHTHGHDDEHAGHTHPRYSAERHPQHVVLDIGGDIGALIVHTSPELLGVEVEISPAGSDDERSHKEVLERTSGDRSEHVLVFESLREGEYTLWVDDIARNRNVRVIGGAIAEVELTAPAEAVTSRAVLR